MHNYIYGSNPSSPPSTPFTVGSALHSLYSHLLRKHLHCLEEVWQSGNEGSQDEEIVEGERRVEADLLPNHLHGIGKRRPKVRVHHNVQEPHDDASPHCHMVDLGIEYGSMGIGYGNGMQSLAYPCPVLGL